MRRLALAACLLALLGGCTPVQPFDNTPTAPLCQDRGRVGSRAVVLMAQAVPTARLVPCIQLFPPGWTYAGQDVRNGRARFWLTSDRAGPRAVEVTLSERCDLSGATQIIPSDQEGTRRYQRILEVRTVYRGIRTYVFEGGCVSYAFTFTGPSRGTPEAEVSLALAFVPRTRLAETLRDVSGGRLHLDPEAD